MIIRWSRRRPAAARAGGRAMLMATAVTLMCLVQTVVCNMPPVFTQDMNNQVLSEVTPVGKVVYTLEGYDPEGGAVRFGLLGTDNFAVDPESGAVTVIKALDREVQETLSFLVTIKDRVAPGGAADSEDDNLVQVPISVIVLDENDNAPEFQNVPYETEVLEDAVLGTTIFSRIVATDRDTVGENLHVSCTASNSQLNGCGKFGIEIMENGQARLAAAVVLRDKLDYNEQMIYHLILAATDGVHTTTTGLEIRVKDVQNSPPIFQGSLAAVIDEDSPIGTLVMTIQAKDGDRGQPRKISYDLITNPMDYFLLDSRSGELRTAKPLDREALPDATGLVVLTIRARELINGVPVSGSDQMTSTTTKASITIRDVNDSPPVFNSKSYAVNLSENTPPGTPLPLDISVHDPDVGQNAVFSLRLDDVSHVFDVEPKIVTGSSQVSIRVSNGTLDYENPNQRKFIVLVIAEEMQTKERLSSTATLTVSITDANDNRPVFDEESYSVNVLETANPGQLITTITARDMDSGRFGDQGIRYSLTGSGANLFHVDPESGAITVAECPDEDLGNEADHLGRRRRQIVAASDSDGFHTDSAKRVNLTLVGQTGVIDQTLEEEEVPEHSAAGKDELAYRVFSSMDETSTSIDLQPINGNEADESTRTRRPNANKMPGRAPCLDFETQSVYFLMYKATDDDGKGQATVVSLRITLLDANDSPPVCDSSLYRASLDEGATTFDPPLQIRARDPDTVSDINYRINGDEMITKLFSIDSRSGQLAIRNTTVLDVTHLSSEAVFFSVEASDGLFTTMCDVNITIRDVNNHAPQFDRDNYMASIAENTAIGTSLVQVGAVDLDTGINAEIRYRIQQGSFDDLVIDNRTGLVTVGRKLDFDRRNTYQIEVVASDLGTPSLSGTATILVNIINSNDKDPYFTPATQRAEVAEDAPIGTVVYRLVALDPDVESSELLDFAATEPITAVDKDGKEITNTEEFKDLFNIDRSGKVTVNKRLNRDIYAVIRITVLVTDTTAPVSQQGQGLLVITIIDVNELPPVFSPPWTPANPKLHFQILEEQPVGSVLTTLQATDADSNIAEYRLEPNAYFEINNATGLIRTIGRIDYETVKEIGLTATVTDTGIPQLNATARLLVDVINTNDNEPHFAVPEYRMSVLENSAKGSAVGKVAASDADDGIFGEIVYTLVGDGARHFHIDSDTGIITVLNTTFLDRERQMEVSLSAVAADKAPITTRKSTTVPVHIKILDVNDNAPIFTQRLYQAAIAENAAVQPPAAILKVLALDADADTFGAVKYQIKRTTEATVTGGADAADGADLFRLDADTGILYPKQSLKGLHGEFRMTVVARDESGSGPNSDEAQISIEVQSINSYRPVFIMPALTNASVELQENLVKANYLVMTVKATDNDTGDNGKITYHLQVNNANVPETEDFSIDEYTGELRTRRQLSRKSHANYELVLVARDQGSPPSETLRFLTISLVDATENKPEFPDASNPYHFTVSENEVRDLRIGKIQAANKGRHHYDHQHREPTIYYYMLLGNENSAFYLDKTTGDLYTNRSLDREETDVYHLYIQASSQSDLHVSDAERAAYSIKSLERDGTVAKVQITVLDQNDNAPEFIQPVLYVGVNARSPLNQLIAVLNASDADAGPNAAFELMVVASHLFKFGSSKSVGSIVPSPFAVSKEGRLSTATFMAEYNQDRFELDVIAKELVAPGRMATAKVFVWIFNPDQLVRVILSRPPSEVNQQQEEIVSELRNATQRRIIIDEIRYHVDQMGRIRMDWCDLFFHAVDPVTQVIVPVDDVLKVIDAHYDFLKDYYAGFAIENVVPAHSTYVEEEFDLALAGLVALLIVLFVGAISFLVLCCCLKHWSVSIPTETRRKDALIKKQIVEDLSTTENPLWIEQKLKLYEEQELTMQVFSEPEMAPIVDVSSQLASAAILMDQRNTYELASQMGDNTYATIQPRHQMASQQQLVGGGGGGAPSEIADYATLRNNSRAPSLYEFTGSTFQAPVRPSRDDNYVAELF